MLSASQQKEVTDQAIAWMKISMQGLGPTTKKFYTFNELYYNDVEFSGKQQEDVTAQYDALWKSSGEHHHGREIC